ncbi:MAG: TolC family protein [Myxococcota bacterium]|nr:TolC family protein [Myxococcota bacterium]
MLLLLANMAGAEELSLQSAMSEALHGNIELQQAGLELQRAEAYVQLVRGGGDPTLSIGTDQTASASPSNDSDDNIAVVNSTDVGLSARLSQGLPTGGALSLGWSESISSSDAASQVSEVYVGDYAWLSVTQPLLAGAWTAARVDVRAALLMFSSQELSHRQSVESLVLQVSDAYWGLVAASEQLRLTTESEAIAEQQFSETTERFEEGFAGSGEVLQVERALGVSRQSVVVAQAEVAASQNRLARLIGRPLQEAEDIQPIERPVVSESLVDLQRSIAQAQDSNSSWLMAKLAAEQARQTLAAARINVLPDLNVSGSLGLSGGASDAGIARQQITELSNPTWSMGADLTVAIPARTARAQRSRALLSADSARLTLAAAEQDLIAAVEAAVQSLLRDRARVRLAQQTLQAAQLALQADQELYREGLASTREVILSLEALNTAQVSMLNAQIDLQAAQLDLLRIEGRLLESLEITPPGW